MINHKFYIYEGSSKEYSLKKVDKSEIIRISDKLISKMKDDLQEFEFTSYVFETQVKGLCEVNTLLNEIDIQKLRKCLLKQSDKEKEYHKFMAFLNRSLTEGKKILHVDGSVGRISHKFAICSELPKRVESNDFKNLVKIQDQFIMENYDIFKNVKLFWGNIDRLDSGFNYYGISIITPDMAQELIDVMSDYLIGNNSEEAEYFLGEEYDVLLEILNQAISKKNHVIHFGI